ncbi:MAG TPA: D-aminoacylase [Candidatus Paceibacterota bacterium]|nr:D-aminoacylase [Candidatus Paceibacterota bacterium]
MKNDLLLRGASVVDGTGRKAFPADITVSNGRISAIENVGTAQRTSREIDADGLTLTPGFVDVHTHCDFSLSAFPRAESMTRQGVTTQVVGNCGISPFPVVPGREHLLREYSAFLDAGLPWGSWHSTQEFFAFLEQLPLASNIAVQVGHGTVRIAAMGFDTGSPNDQDLEMMCKFVAEAMAAGAVGMSSGLTYAPASAASTAELIALAKVLAPFGGIYSSHIRSEATGLIEAVNEAIEIGTAAGVPVQISHLKAMGRNNWNKIDDTLRLIDRAVSEGVDIAMDQYPYSAGSTGLAVILPRWAMAGGVTEMQRRLQDPEQRIAIRSQIIKQDAEDIRAGLRELDPDVVVIADLPPGRFKQYVGQSLTQIGQALGEHPVDVALDMLEEFGNGILTLVHGQSQENVSTVMQHPRTMIASDGWTLSPTEGGKPHPRSYGTFARVLGRYVREDHVLTLEDAVRKMTSLPASRFSLADRGLIREGFHADMVLFDKNTILDTATFEDPHQFAIGVKYVLVNGELIIAEGQDTGVAAGRVLKRGIR